MDKYYELLGRAQIDTNKLLAGSLATWTIIYEAGCMGVDDMGEILIARRDVSDADIPQFADPASEGFVSVSTEADAKLEVSYIPDRYIRPWKSCISIRVRNGYLSKGDKIYIKFGSERGLGYRVQTYSERKHIFMIFVDNMGSGNFYQIKESPTVEITGSYPDKIEAIIPSVVCENEKFDIKLRALDSWGNISEIYNGRIEITLDDKVFEVELKAGLGIISQAVFSSKGFKYPVLRSINDNISCLCNPVNVLSDSDGSKIFWGDMHGQTAETVGTGTIDEYFQFARDKAFLDFSAWQGNDFQISDEVWEELNRVTMKYHEPAKFITYPGYEWSGNHPVGGDYNIYFKNEGQNIYRSSSWQTDLLKHHKTNRYTISELWKEFENRNDVIAIPHVGGRCANLEFVNNKFVDLIEIHSHHGTFEWFFKEALKRDLKVGVVATSDDHTGRPGLSYPTQKTSRGFVSFDVRGGYTAIFSKDLTRNGIWEALKNRHCYATSGERIILDVRCANAVMGDELDLTNFPEIDITALGSTLIEEIEIYNGVDVIYRLSDEMERHDDIIQIKWGGIGKKTRSKKTDWAGTISITDGRFIDVIEKCFNNFDSGITRMSNQILKLNSSTSGDYNVIDIEVDYNERSLLIFNSNNVNFSVNIDSLKRGRKEYEAGGVNQYVEIDMKAKCEKQDHKITFIDKAPIVGSNKYWVKVIQADGHMAWSSPIYVNYSDQDKTN